MRKLLTLLGVLMLFYCLTACKDDIHQGRITFPDIIVRAYQFIGKEQFVFTVRTPYGIIIEDFDKNNTYSYKDVMFRGWVDANLIQINNQQIQKDVTDYLYNNYPEYIENVEVGFVQEKLKSINIYSDKNFNGIKAGESLNSFFIMNSRLVQFRKGKYILFDGNILGNKFFTDTFIPAWVDVQLKVRPTRPDTYSFFVEMETENNVKHQSEIIEINIK